MDTGEAGPAVFDDVVEGGPVPGVVKFAGGFGTYAPDIVEVVENLERGVCVEEVCGGESACWALLIFVEEVGDFGVAAGEGEDFGRASEFVGVGCDGGDGGAVGADANLIEGELADLSDLEELVDKGFVWGVEGGGAQAGEEDVVLYPVWSWREGDGFVVLGRGGSVEFGGVASWVVGTGVMSGWRGGGP